jgi:hypothetical protein
MHVCACSCTAQAMTAVLFSLLWYAHLVESGVLCDVTLVCMSGLTVMYQSIALIFTYDVVEQALVDSAGIYACTHILYLVMFVAMQSHTNNTM